MYQGIYTAREGTYSVVPHKERQKPTPLLPLWRRRFEIEFGSESTSFSLSMALLTYVPHYVHVWVWRLT